MISYSYTSAMMSPIMGSYTLAGLVMDVSENETLQGSHLSQKSFFHSTLSL